MTIEVETCAEAQERLTAAYTVMTDSAVGRAFEAGFLSGVEWYEEYLRRLVHGTDTQDSTN